jgi:hypothetical protein
MVNVGIFLKPYGYDHFLYFMPILWPFGIFSPFWYVVPKNSTWVDEKRGNVGRRNDVAPTPSIHFIHRNLRSTWCMY